MTYEQIVFKYSSFQHSGLSARLTCDLLPTYRLVYTVDPLHVSGHDLYTRLLGPTHVLIEQVVSLNE